MSRAPWLLLLPALLAFPVAASAAPARASLTDIENDVMCVACHEPLAVAQSPEAVRERAFISSLIRQGDTKPQIERQLVAQYGPAVLGRPPAHGFSLLLYVLPPALVVMGLAILAYALPRWRRRARIRAAVAVPPPPGPTLRPEEAARLDDELSRYGG